MNRNRLFFIIMCITLACIMSTLGTVYTIIKVCNISKDLNELKSSTQVAKMSEKIDNYKFKMAINQKCPKLKLIK